MKRTAFGALAALALLFYAPAARAQKLRIPSDSYGFCFRLIAPGSQPISASCTVTVYDAGTTNLSTIYSTTGGGAQANPFAAGTNGTWVFYATAGVAYDVRLSGGTPAMTPYTISNVQSAGGSISTFSSGNLSPLFTTSVANPSTAPALSFSLSNAAANTVFGRCTGTMGAPSYCSLTNAMLPAPGSPTQMFYNSSGLFAATSGLTWDDTNRRASWINGANNAFLSLQPGTISWASTGGTNAPRISNVFSEFDFLGGASDDILVSQSGSQHLFLPASDKGLAQLGTGAASGSVQLNDGTTIGFQGPLLKAATATPEGNVTGRVGSLFMRADGGSTSTALYVKEAGAGNTGWFQVSLADSYSCGTVAACSPTLRLNPHTFFGSAALVSGMPSTVTITAMAPAFSSSATYKCTLNNETATADVVNVSSYASGASFVISGPNTVSDIVGFICTGY